MKKVFTLFFTVLVAGIINNTDAQTCTPNHPGYTAVPDSGILIPKVLPDAQVGVYYEQPVTIGTPDSASGYPLNWIQYASLTNYITTNAWTVVNNTGGTTFPQWSKSTWQCVTIKGTPTTTGTDSLRIFVNANVSILGFPYTQNNVKAFVLPLLVTAATDIQDYSNARIKLIESYPNPAINNITIETQQKSTIEILNIQGLTIIQRQLQQGKTDINLNGLAKGVYILRLYSNDKTEVTRIVKE